MRLLFATAVILLVAPADAQTRYAWVGGSSGDWTDASNWSPNGVPAATDTALVGEAGQSQRQAILTQNTTVARLEVIGLGVVAGTFDLTITDHLQWEGGGSGWETFRGTGTLTIASGATAHFAEGTTRYQMASGRTLVNDGSILWDGAGVWQGGGKLVNNGEILLAMSGSDLFVFSGLPDAFTNTASGVIRRAGTGSPQFSSGMVNEGLIRVESGALNLRGFNSNGVRGAGTIEVQTGARLDVGGGVNEVASVTGGALDLGLGNNSTLRVSGAYDVTTTRITSNGTLRLDGTSTSETLEMAAGTIEGSGTLTITGSMAWTGGSMAGTGTTTLGPSVALDLSGTQVSVSGSRTLRLEGPTTWTGEADIGSGTSTSTIVNVGTMTSSGAGERVTNFVQFRNEGTIIHDGGTLRFQGPMSNTGEVRVEDGTFTLQFASTGTDTGRYEVASTGRLQFESNSRILSPDLEIAGTGTATIASTVVDRATWTPGASPGTLTIDGDWPEPEPEAVLDIEIGGRGAGTDFDQLVVTGAAALGGTLRVTLADGFAPNVGDRFQVVAASGGATGTFDAVELPSALTADVEVSASGVELVVSAFVDDEDAPGQPAELALHPPAPHPARAASTLRIDLPAPARVRLAVYDALGREVAVALDDDRPAGRHAVALATDGLAPGVYVIRLLADDQVRTQPLTVVR